MADGNMMIKIAIGTALGGGFLSTFSKVSSAVRNFDSTAGKATTNIAKMSLTMRALSQSYKAGIISASTYSNATSKIRTPLAIA